MARRLLRCGRPCRPGPQTVTAFHRGPAAREVVQAGELASHLEGLVEGGVYGPGSPKDTLLYKSDRISRVSVELPVRPHKGVHMTDVLTSRYEVRPASPVLGAEIVGVDLAEPRRRGHGRGSAAGLLDLQGSGLPRPEPVAATRTLRRCGSSTNRSIIRCGSTGMRTTGWSTPSTWRRPAMRPAGMSAVRGATRRSTSSR